MGIISPERGTYIIESKRSAKSTKRPEIDLGACSKCGGCIEVAPGIFTFNVGGGYLEVSDLEHYDQELVDEAIKNCPEDCISWKED